MRIITNIKFVLMVYLNSRAGVPHTEDDGSVVLSVTQHQSRRTGGQTGQVQGVGGESHAEGDCLVDAEEVSDGGLQLRVDTVAAQLTPWTAVSEAVELDRLDGGGGHRAAILRESEVVVASEIEIPVAGY